MAPGSPPRKIEIDLAGSITVQNIPQYNQGLPDPHAEEEDYAGWKPGGYCGPTSLQMLAEFHGYKLTRDQIARTSARDGEISLDKGTMHGSEYIYAWDKGTARANIPDVMKKLGFRTADLRQGEDYSRLRYMVRRSTHLLVNVKGRVKFTDEGPSYKTGGHYMVLVGMDANDNPIVNDPYPWKAEQEVPVQRIMDRESFENAWSRGGAMWLKLIP